MRVPLVAAWLLIRFASSSPTLARHFLIASNPINPVTVVTEGYSSPVGVL